MVYNNCMNNKIPKSITKGPSALAVVLSIISIVVWVPHTLPFGGVQTIYAIGLLPIGIASFFFSYYSGLTIAKLSYGIAKKTLHVLGLFLANSHQYHMYYNLFHNRNNSCGKPDTSMF